ncbi:MAG: 4-(cytidine 5'-diphospho)-2-C-methyl-D-erythritol kinase [Magnetococcales bacterium]|nr:4-(cytidine 5'-diphospho)-2-C-methyl-D-erythritol kinase [Magnetococcales bacterium]
MNRRFLAPAKVNLTLRVVGRRADGYHLLESLMFFFPLYDILEITPLPEGLELHCEPAVTALPEENLVLRAARLLAQVAGVKRGARLRLVKHIPDGAGLGGGSSDAALTLLALNRMWDVQLGRSELMALGLKLGADLPFFLGGEAALVGGVGERLTPLPTPLTGTCVVVFPGEGLATRRVFQALDGRFPCRPEPLGLPRAGEDLALWLENDLTLPALELMPGIGVAHAALLGVGARGAVMSGSGSTVVGLFADSGQAEQAVARLVADHPGWRIFAGALLNEHPFLSEANH